MKQQTEAKQYIEPETKCPTCGTPCNISWNGLDLVNNTGDETLATKNYHPLPTFDEIKNEQLVEELAKALQDVIEWHNKHEQISFIDVEIISNAKQVLKEAGL